MAIDLYSAIYMQTNKIKNKSKIHSASTLPNLVHETQKCTRCLTRATCVPPGRAVARAMRPPRAHVSIAQRVASRHARHDARRAKILKWEMGLGDKAYIGCPEILTEFKGTNLPPDQVCVKPRHGHTRSVSLLFTDH